MKCQAGNKYALSITIKFDQSTRRFGRIRFARLFKFTKHIALLFYLTIFTVVYKRFKKCQNEYAYYSNNNEILRALEYRLRYGEFRRRWDSNSVRKVCAALQRPIISKCQHSKCQHSAKFGNTVHIKFSLIFANFCLLAK